MKKLYEGKTKTVYQLPSGDIQLFFKDDVTGTDGVFDPGANKAELVIQDNGYYGLLLTKYFFEQLEEKGIATHYLESNLENRTMNVMPVTFFGKGIEVICRLEATGSFIRRYGAYANDGDTLDYYAEISLKDDDRGDPFISQELLEHFSILEPGEYQHLIAETKKITRILNGILTEKGLELIDLKLEFGKDKNGNIILIDELSGGNMRVYKDRKSIDPISLTKLVVEEK